MPKITYVAQDGRRHELEVEPGHNLMEAAVGAGIDGIVGQCGGQMMCATCHVYVDPGWVADLPEMSATEDVMLDSAMAARQPNSRLSCQLVVTPAFEGLVVTMPAAQV
jgi:ferredoxin, 2Fe-2S